jgi:ribonuclease inhibitor
MDEPRKKQVNIDLNNIETSKQLQIVLKEKLEFPDFYGKNWNAFWDAITGLVELPETIVFENWKTLKQKLPEEANYLKTTLNEFNEKYPKWKSEVKFL